MRLSDYLALLRAFFGNENPVTAVATQFTRFVNQAYEEAVRVAGITYWTKRYWSTLTLPQVSQTGANGVATATGGSRVVTLAAASRIDRRYIGSMMRIGGTAETYLISDITGPLAPIIDPPFSGATFGTAVTNQDVLIRQANYRLPPDLIAIGVVKQSQTPLRLFSISQRTVDEWTPDPMLLGETGRPEVYMAVGSGGLPAIWGTQVQRDLGATAGTIQVANNSPQVTVGAGGSDLLNNMLLTVTGGDATRSILPGMHFIATADGRPYRLRSVTGAFPTVALDEAYGGTTDAVAEFLIGPSEPGWIRVYPVPNDTLHLDLEYYALPDPLQLNNDAPVLPRDLHQVIGDGALMHLARYTGNVAMGQQYERDFDAGLERIKAATQGTGDLTFRFRSRGRMERYGDGLVSPRIPNIVVVS